MLPLLSGGGGGGGECLSGAVRGSLRAVQDVLGDQWSVATEWLDLRPRPGSPNNIYNKPGVGHAETSTSAIRPLLVNVVTDPGETTPISPSSEEYAAIRRQITAVPDQNGRGSDPKYAICGAVNLSIAGGGERGGAPAL